MRILTLTVKIQKVTLLWLVSTRQEMAIVLELNAFYVLNVLIFYFCVLVFIKAYKKLELKIYFFKVY